MQSRSNVQLILNIKDMLEELNPCDSIKYITLMKDTIVSSVPPQNLGTTLLDLYEYFITLYGPHSPGKKTICSGLIKLFTPELLATSDFDLLEKFFELEKNSGPRSDIAHAMVSSISSHENLLSIVESLDSDKKYSLIETHKKYFDQLRQVNKNNIVTTPSPITVSTSAFATFQSDAQIPAATGNEIAPEHTKLSMLN